MSYAYLVRLEIVQFPGYELRMNLVQKISHEFHAKKYAPNLHTLNMHYFATN